MVNEANIPSGINLSLIKCSVDYNGLHYELKFRDISELNWSLSLFDFIKLSISSLFASISKCLSSIWLCSSILLEFNVDETDSFIYVSRLNWFWFELSNFVCIFCKKFNLQTLM